MTNSKLFTIGYEGATFDEFVARLRKAGIAVLVDIRAVAASRRPGFSKSALAAGLREQGIDYLHLRALGTPKAGREAARKGRIGEMRAIYAEQLATPEAGLAFAQLREAVRERPSALLCYEADAAGCHRAVVAEQMAAGDGFTIVDL